MTEFFYCNKTEFARITGDSVRTISRYITEGMPVAVPGRSGQPLKINTAHAIAWYVDKQAKLQGYVRPQTGDEQNLENGDARNLVYVEQHRKLKLENDEKEGRIHPAEQVDYVITSMIAMQASILDGFAGRWAGGDSILRQKILDDVRRAREEFANGLRALMEQDASALDGFNVTPYEESGVEVGEG